MMTDYGTPAFWNRQRIQTLEHALKEIEEAVRKQKPHDEIAKIIAETKLSLRATSEKEFNTRIMG